MISSVIKGEGLLKLIIKTAALAVLVLCLASCAKNSGSTAPLGALFVDGPGLTGSVPVGTTRLYTLLGIGSGLNYTVRTEIATKGTGTTAPDGTLTVSIYRSQTDYISDPTTSIAVLVPDTNYPFVYEANFDAPSSGDYIAAISGAADTISDVQFFYDLRLMSADARGNYLVNFVSSVTSTMAASSPIISTLNVGYLNVYSGGSLTLSGSYPIKINPVPTSAATSTIAYPQLFVYGNSSLKIDSLLYSCVTDSMNFIVTDFTSNPTGSVLMPDPNNNITNGVTITGVPFTSASPFIVVKGTSTMQYFLTVGP